MSGTGGPTYYVRHPDDTYTVADPQPTCRLSAEGRIPASMDTLRIDPHKPESFASPGEIALMQRFASGSHHDWQPDGGVLKFESHPNGESPHVHTTCSKCGARAWFLQYLWELLAAGCTGTSTDSATKHVPVVTWR